MLTRIYRINDGNIFEGTIEQFMDCFFSDATSENIEQWCKDNGYNYETFSLDEKGMNKFYKKEK